MLPYLLGRVLQLIPVLLLATVLVFLVIRLIPGDPATIQLGMRMQRPNAEETLGALRKEMGLDQPIPVQYAIWLGHVVRGDLGSSSRSELPVTGLIAQKLPITLELIVAGMAVALVVSLVLGVLAATRRGSRTDFFAGTVSLIGVAMPSFWLGLLLIMVFAVELRWLPVSGFVPPSKDPVDNLRHLVLPALSLVVVEVAIFTRFIRSETLEVLREDYIRTAHAKGMSPRLVIVRHALRNSLTPVITVMALEFATLLGGVVIIEQIFLWPGIGMLTLQAITDRDYPVLQGVVLVIALFVVLANLAADMLNAYLDPRIRSGAARS